MATRKKPSLPSGTYKTKIVSLGISSIPGQLTLTLDVESFKTDKEIDPKDAIRGRYFIIYQPLKYYTTIAARNVHHAINKATRDCSGKYTSIQDGSNTYREQALMALGFKFLPLAKYNQAVQADLLTEV